MGRRDRTNCRATAVRPMSWEFGLALMLSLFAAGSFAICRFARWHKRRFLRIPNSTINAHRITPRFNVGADVK